MPKCISCNEVYADQLRRCPHCGYAAEPIPQEARPARPASRRRRLPRVRRLALVAVLAAGAGLAAVVAWPSPKVPQTDDLPRRHHHAPDEESEQAGTARPDEIKAEAVETGFQVTAARREDDRIVVTGTCSPHAIAEVLVNGRRATILWDGSRFVMRLPNDAGKVEVVATGVRGDTATRTAAVTTEPVPETEGEDVRLLKLADGATMHVPSVELSYMSLSGAAAACTTQVPLPNVENRFRIEGSRFVLYRAPDDLVYLRTTKNGVRTFLREIDDQEMVLVPGGLSWRGMGDGEPNGPRHLVEMSPFLIDRTEVTNRQYARFLHALHSGVNVPVHAEDPGISPRPVGWTDDDPPAGTEDLPVTGISWYSAWSYARWTGGHLPTEAQWERAAAGPLGRAYPWGDTFDAHLCWAQRTGPMAADLLVEGAGFFDLLHASGNVREWCLDRYDPRWYLRGSRHDPRGPSRTMHRVVRGGSFASPPEALRLQYRDHFDATKKALDLGFRVARDWDASESPDGD
jgi:formylglycine-generating enzyme required for sulfatase activity